MTLSELGFKGGIGDLASCAKGSGARFNDGKPPVELLLWKEVKALLAEPHQPTDPEVFNAWVALGQLGSFQETLDFSFLSEVIDILFYGDYQLAMYECARVFGYGAKKYAAWNWAKGMKWSVPLACAGRHLLAQYQGEKHDKESGETHRGHVVCNLMMLTTYKRLFPEGNDLTNLVGLLKPSDATLNPITQESAQCQNSQSEAAMEQEREAAMLARISPTRRASPL